MSAKTDLDNALQYVTDGINAHVSALVAARNTAAAASAAAGDTTHLVTLTGKLTALGDLLASSVSAAVAEVEAVVAPVVAKVEAVVAPVVAEVEAVVAPVLPSFLLPAAPVPAPNGATAHVPSVAETMQAVISKITNP